MENLAVESGRKRKSEAGGNQGERAVTVEEDKETNLIGSEEMEANVTRILQKIEQFTERVSELLDVGKKLFKAMSDEFEEKMIRIHEEQMEKWSEEIKELRFLDSGNEEINARLQNVHYLLQTVRGS